MEIFKDANHDIQTHILRMNMTYNVFPEILSNTNECFCKTCACNGLPCVHCATHRFCGVLGPGMHDGKRVMFVEDIEDDEFESFVNMMSYLENHHVWVHIVRNVENLQVNNNRRCSLMFLSLMALPFVGATRRLFRRPYKLCVK